MVRTADRRYIQIMPALRAVAVTAVIYICATLAASCSAYRDYEAKQPANVWKMESMLNDAGFRRVWISTPAQHSAVDELPLYRLNRYQAASGSVYWYADPDYCGCLFEGDQAVYDRYAMLMQQDRDTAAYVDQRDEEQLAMLGPFGYAFPPPLILGGWPVAFPVGGGGGGRHRGGRHPILPRGGGGHVVGRGGGGSSGGGGGGGHHGGGHGHGR